jgi:uncharacterized protein (DUF2132 family)
LSCVWRLGCAPSKGQPGATMLSVGVTDQPNNPLHGVTLKAILEDLVARHGWEALGEQIKVRCFLHEPSISSSLKLLRKTPWAREKVERLYLADQRSMARRKKQNQRRSERRAHNPEDAPTEEVEASGGDEVGEPQHELG